MTAWVLVAASAVVHALPAFDEVRRGHRASDSLLLDRDGVVIHRLRTDATVRRGEWVALADISPALRTALVLSEDRRFYEHSGVDWQAVPAAAWANLWNTRTRGASTLSMQLAGLLDEAWAQGPGGRSVAQKLGQAVAAQVLDRRWRKDQILEAYLNLVPFRGELVGIDALSRTLFGKAAHGLDEREAAIAAALVRAPNAGARVVAQRACGVLKAVQAATTAVDCDGLDLFATGALQRRAFDASEGIAPHVARKLLTGQAASVRSTLRAPLQRMALQTLQQHLRELRGRNVEDGAVVVLDNATGQVLAWVGSSGALSRAAEVDGVTALRQAGSTLKPFLYAQALAERRLTAASLLEDAPTHIPTASGLYIPQNYDRQFKGWVSARTALGASLNVPAVRTLVMVSPDAFARQLGAAWAFAAAARRPLWLQPGAGQRRSAAAGPGQCLPHAGQWRARQRHHADAARQTCVHPGRGPTRRLHRGRHAQRPERPRAHLWHRQPAGHPLLDSRENRHQQGHARQLGGGLQPALHGGRVGGQCRRRRHA
jgi:penicillin-binding protein 1C